MASNHTVAMIKMHNFVYLSVKQGSTPHKLYHCPNTRGHCGLLQVRVTNASVFVPLRSIDQRTTESAKDPWY